MITIYKNNVTGLETIEQPTTGCWLNVIDPNEQEIAFLQETLCVPQDFITSPLDQGEMPRTEKENGSMLIVLRVPSFQGVAADVPYSTAPLGIVVNHKMVATICKSETNTIKAMIAGRARSLSTGKRNRFILQVLWLTANRYLSDLREINKTTDNLEDKLQHALRNKELLELLKYQKSLVYFTTALKANELLLRHLQKSQLFQQYPDDQELLDDVLIEIEQAIEMTNIASNILSQMMDAFASIISNNLNVVMKVLASITIILSFPTMVASFYGMNVSLPFEEHSLAFVGVIGVALLISFVVLFVLRRRDWL